MRTSLPTGQCSYWIANLVRDPVGQGWRPDFPKRAAFTLLADGRRTRFGIYECELTRRRAKGHEVREVEDGLTQLIRSGKRYAPALALARRDVERAFLKTSPSRSRFLKTYTDSLRRHLRRMPTAPYVMALANRDDLGYLCKGEWYWTLRMRAGPTGSVVSWVSSDYYIYENPIEDFVLNTGQLRRFAPRLRR